VYQIENQRQAVEGTRALGSSQAGRPKVSRNVVFLGLNSLLTDISSEMVSTILPLYLLFTLRLAPLQFGIIDGLYQGGSVLVRVASGLIADRWRHPKEVAAVGYGISAVCKLGLLVISWPLGGDHRAGHAGPHRQGNPHGSAGCDDLIERPAQRDGHGVRSAPGS
jgi:hypothetical protein